MIWRVGSKVPLNVYEGDRPVCQCHTAEDAARIVTAMNDAESRDSAVKESLTADCQDLANAADPKDLQDTGMVCKLCGSPAEFHADERAWRHIVGESKQHWLCDRYGYPISVEQAPKPRDIRQRRVRDWCAAAFGAGHAASIPQRGIRHAEEAIEAAQAAGCDQAMVHKLVDHIYSKEPGKLHQEIGGSGITLLALAQAAGLSADAEEVREMERVLAKPLEHFASRNKVKNDAGFNVAGDAPEERG